MVKFSFHFFVTLTAFVVHVSEGTSLPSSKLLQEIIVNFFSDKSNIDFLLSLKNLFSVSVECNIAYITELDSTVNKSKKKAKDKVNVMK